MKSLKLVLILLLVSVSASAKKLVILTDEPQGTKAQAIKKLIGSTAPFNFLKASEFAVTVKVITEKVKCEPLTIKYTAEEVRSLEYYAKLNGIVISDADKKKYREGYTINRLVSCDEKHLSQIALGEKADSVIFVHKSPYEGGSGGDIPIILSGSREGIGLHEWLHSFGLADEYAYSKEEAPFYCQNKNYANVAIFNDAPPYPSNEDVRVRHGDQIAWLPFLSKNAALITGDQLGSPTFGNLGIFASQTCNAVVPKVKSWKPTSYFTIMQNPHTHYIPKPYWTAVLSGLGVSNDRIAELLKKEVKPTWSTKVEPAPVSPPGGLNPKVKESPLGTDSNAKEL